MSVVSGIIHHVVLFKVKPECMETSADAVAAMVRAITDFPHHIPTVLSSACGPTFTLRGKGYTHCFVITVASKRDLQVYLDHPHHLHVKETFIKPIVEEVLAMDIAAGGTPLMAESDLPLLEWGSTQGHILTGGGAHRLLERFVPGRDYTVPDDLPHTLKTAGTSHETFQRWIKEGKNGASAVCGAWSRPLFSGGWRESTAHDTAVYNLQTPSIFIDLRFPIRASCRDLNGESILQARSRIARKGTFDALSLAELRVLSRQHCFAGYTLASADSRWGKQDSLVCTRHHAIDWNYHPSFPRPRPNKWRVEVSPEGTSFKEFGYALDEYGQSLYMERWARLPGDGGGVQYLALRRRRQTGTGKPDSFLIVVGNHFAFTRDRAHPLPAYSNAKGGGCGNLVDAAHDRKSAKDMVAMLDLEGSHGLVNNTHNTTTTSGAERWCIDRSTLPWKEGSSLFQPGDITLRWGKGSLKDVVWDGSAWDVLECGGFSKAQLQALFSNATSKL